MTSCMGMVALVSMSASQFSKGNFSGAVSQTMRALQAEVVAAMRAKLAAPPESAVILVAMPAEQGPDSQPVGIVEMYKDAVPDIAARLHKAQGSEFGFGWLASMAVDEAYQRRGLGSTLVAEAQRPVKEQWGYDWAALHVFEDNEAALKLYEAAGFEKVETS